MCMRACVCVCLHLCFHPLVKASVKQARKKKNLHIISDMHDVSQRGLPTRLSKCVINFLKLHFQWSSVKCQFQCVIHHISCCCCIISLSVMTMLIKFRLISLARSRLSAHTMLFFSLFYLSYQPSTPPHHLSNTCTQLQT